MLPGVLRAWLPGIRNGGPAPGCCFSGACLGSCGSSRSTSACCRYSRHRTHRRYRSSRDCLVVDPKGTVVGFQDKVQIDPSEEAIYAHGSGRQLFHVGPVRFGIVICHEAWRYPETVRWAVQRGAQVVFHPHYHIAAPEGYVPSTFADPRNTFHEKAMLCRAAENTCYFASVNCASDGSPSTSAVVRPDGSLLCYQPYGKEGLLIADIDLDTASGLFASRCKYAGR